MKVLAMNIHGDMTYCTCPPELRGTGRCNHVAHQMEDESPAEFLERVEAMQESGELHFESLIQEGDGDGSGISGGSDQPFGEKAFIPYEGTKVETRPYRMTDEEKQHLVKIENRAQLEQAMNGGYIELETPLWNDMDKNYWCQQTGFNRKSLNQVLRGEAKIVLQSESSRFPAGRVVANETLEQWEKEGYPRGWDKNCRMGTGVLAMNEYAEQALPGFQATKDVYVIPYWMRMGIADHTQDYRSSSADAAALGEPQEEVSSDITLAYKYLLRNHKNPDKQQLAYEALLDNSGLPDDYARFGNGYRNHSLSDEFAGKGGVFRAVLSGGSIPYTGRAVAVPNADLKYGELGIPASMAVDIFRPTIIHRLAEKNYGTDEIQAFMDRYRSPYFSEKDRMELERLISDRRVAMNRQPSLHQPSFQSYRPRISGKSGPGRMKEGDAGYSKPVRQSVCVEANPLYCKGYNLDFDGDEVHVYAFNADEILPVVDRTIDSGLEVNTRLPRQQHKSTIMPSKDALFGLLSILQANDGVR